MYELRTNNESQAEPGADVLVARIASHLFRRENRRPLFAWPHELKAAGVLGINHRNMAFIQESNPRALYPRVDDKTITKQICHENEIPVPETYAVIRRYGDVRRLAELIGGRGEFVVKPASGAAGRGIIVIARRYGDDY